ATVRTYHADNPLDELRHRVAEVKVAKVAGLPPFIGGAVGYAGYDTVRYVEKLPNPPEDDRHLADLSFAFYDHMVVFDNVQKTVQVIALAKVKGVDPRAAYDDACRRVDRLVEKLSSETSSLRPTDLGCDSDALPSYRANFTQEEFEAAVSRCVEYIRAGDIFQVVLSQRLEVELSVDPFEVYR